jgi:hypothetical protein
MVQLIWQYESTVLGVGSKTKINIFKKWNAKMWFQLNGMVQSWDFEISVPDLRQKETQQILCAQTEASPRIKRA